MSAHQLSLAPAACPYMVRPLCWRSCTSPYKGRNLNTGYTLFSAPGLAIDEGAAERLRCAGSGSWRQEARSGHCTWPDVADPVAARPAVVRFPPPRLPSLPHWVSEVQMQMNQD